MIKHVGFTLLEILISVAILSTVAILIAQVFYTTTRVNSKSVIVQDIKQDGEFALDIMRRHIRGAKYWYRSCDEGATSTDSAAIRTTNGEIITFSCQSDGSSARIASESGSGNVIFLTNNNITLSDSNGIFCDDSTLTFSCPQTSDIAEPMEIRFTLTQRSDSTSLFENARSDFESSVAPRGL